MSQKIIHIIKITVLFISMCFTKEEKYQQQLLGKNIIFRIKYFKSTGYVKNYISSKCLFKKNICFIFELINKLTN